jgi:DNA-binding response OmpR family regulator
MRAVINDSFQRFGMDVFQYSSAAEILRMAERDQPDLILVEVGLPDLDGDLTIRQLKAVPATTPIPMALMGSQEEPILAEKARSCGADAYLCKPFTPHELLVWFRTRSVEFYGEELDLEQLSPVVPEDEGENDDDRIPLTPEEIQTLLLALKDKSKGVRMEACYQLGEARLKEAIDPLVFLLFDEEDEVRAEAAFALGEIGDPQAIPDLMPLLSYKNSLVRERIAEALGAIGDPMAVAPLIGVLRSQDASLVVLAIKAITKIGDPSAIPAIEALVTHRNPEVIANATWALREFSGAN